jgi:SAM-dependent methyltransferase
MTTAALRTRVKQIPDARGVSRLVARCAASLRFLKDFRRFAALQDGRFDLRWRDRYPCLDGRTATTGFDRHYVYHTAWAARVLARTRPELHVDISSSLYFCSQVSAFVPVRFYDFRPPDLLLDNLQCERADVCALPFADGSIASLSCMHVVEHVGLGRYGDPLDPAGDLQAMAELRRVLAPEGDLLLVVPIGRPRIMYNAHRIYSYGQVLAAFSGLELHEFSLIPDGKWPGGLITHASPELADGQNYGCGCFWFRRCL